MLVDAKSAPARRAGEGAARRGARAGWHLTRWVVALWRQIVKTKPESQWIVITRPLYHLQQPVFYSSRLQVIHRAGSGNCDRSRLMQLHLRMAAPAR